MTGKKYFKNYMIFLKPGGSLWISDLISHDTPEIDLLFKNNTVNTLNSLEGKITNQKF